MSDKKPPVLTSKPIPAAPRLTVAETVVNFVMFLDDSPDAKLLHYTPGAMPPLQECFSDTDLREQWDVTIRAVYKFREDPCAIAKAIDSLVATLDASPDAKVCHVSLANRPSKRDCFPQHDINQQRDIVLRFIHRREE